MIDCTIVIAMLRRIESSAPENDNRLQTDYLLTSDAVERASLLSHGWKEYCTPFGGMGVVIWVRGFAEGTPRLGYSFCALCIWVKCVTHLVADVTSYRYVWKILPERTLYNENPQQNAPSRKTHHPFALHNVWKIHRTYTGLHGVVFSADKHKALTILYGGSRFRTHRAVFSRARYDSTHTNEE